MDVDIVGVGDVIGVGGDEVLPIVSEISDFSATRDEDVVYPGVVTGESDRGNGFVVQ